MRSRNALLAIAYAAARRMRRLGLYDLRLYSWLRSLARRTLFRRSPEFPLPYLEIRVDDLRLTVPSSVVWVYEFGGFEPGTRNLISETLRPGMTFVDVGAHVGIMALSAARRVGQSGRIFAVEPAPDNLVFLRHNAEVNDASNLTILPVAAGEVNGSGELILRGSGDRHGLVADDTEPTLGTASVPIRPLDDLVEGTVDLVKIDAEGSDLEVLHGMDRIRAENPGLQILVEWNLLTLTNAGYPFGELPRQLSEMGFECRLVVERTGELVPIDETLAAERAGRLGAGWFANLLARPRAGAGTYSR